MIATNNNNLVPLSDRTRNQSNNVSFISSTNNFDEEVLSDVRGAEWIKLVRKMRCDPTIALVRYLYAAIPAVAGWSIEKKDNAPLDAEDLIKDEIMPIRLSLLRTAMLGCADFGWAPYEIVYKIRSDMMTGIRKIKSLLQDFTEIRVVRRTGSFYGLRQYDVDGAEVLLDVYNSLLLNMDMEGTDWFGNGLMKNAVIPYNDSRSVSDTAARYDKKIAGANWVIKYPEGTTIVDGTEKTNDEVARNIGNMLQASGVLTIPKNVSRMISDLQSTADGDTYEWEVELITADGAQSNSFNERMSYLDKLKVRAFGFPERSILEGQFGTKAEAGEHINMTFAVLQLRHQELVQQINWHLINKLLIANYGMEAENTVFLTANPVVDEQRDMFKDLYDKLLSNPNSFLQEWDNMDLSAIRETLNIPTIDNEMFGDNLIPNEIIPVASTGVQQTAEFPIAV